MYSLHVKNTHKTRTHVRSPARWKCSSAEFAAITAFCLVLQAAKYYSSLVANGDCIWAIVRVLRLSQLYARNANDFGIFQVCVQYSVKGEHPPSQLAVAVRVPDRLPFAAETSLWKTAVSPRKIAPPSPPPPAPQSPDSSSWSQMVSLM